MSKRNFVSDEKIYIENLRSHGEEHELPLSLFSWGWGQRKKKRMRVQRNQTRKRERERERGGWGCRWSWEEGPCRRRVGRMQRRCLRIDGSGGASLINTIQNSRFALPLNHPNADRGEVPPNGTMVPRGTNIHQPSDRAKWTYMIWYLLSGWTIVKLIGKTAWAY